MWGHTLSVCVCDFFIPTFELSSRSLLFSRAWLVLNTIQSNSALYSDFAMESLTVPAYTHTTQNTSVSSWSKTCVFKSGTGANAVLSLSLSASLKHRNPPLLQLNHVNITVVVVLLRRPTGLSGTLMQPVKHVLLFVNLVILFCVMLFFCNCITQSHSAARTLLL